MSLTITKGYSTGSPLTKAHLDNAFADIETKFNTTLIATAELQDSAITAAKIAASIVDETKLSASVAGNGLAGGAGTALSVNVDSSTIEINSDTLRVKDLGIVTAKINDGAVTRAKQAALGQQISSSCSNFSSSSASFVDVTNLSVSITTTGRPVFLALISDGDGTSDASINPSVLSNVLVLKIDRSGTRVGTWSFGASGVNQPLTHIDPVAAGTYTYKIQVKITAGTAFVSYVKLVAFEL